MRSSRVSLLRGILVGVGFVIVGGAAIAYNASQFFGVARVLREGALIDARIVEVTRSERSGRSMLWVEVPSSNQLGVSKIRVIPDQARVHEFLEMGTYPLMMLPGDPGSAVHPDATPEFSIGNAVFAIPIVLGTIFARQSYQELRRY